MFAAQFLRGTALVLLASACTAVPVLADYATPGIGLNYTMDQLVAASGGAVTGSDGVYEVNESVIISLSDRLNIDPGTTVTFVDTAGEIGLEINGALVAVGTETERIVFTGSVATPGTWRGLDYRDTGGGSQFHIAYGEIAYADEAVDVFGGDILLENCEIHHSLSKAVDISSGDGEVRFCDFHDNQQRTITMTLTSSPTIEDCHLENNNVENSSPLPYISIGVQGVNSPTIRRNTIIGSGYEMSGGIAIWLASNALIEENHIEGCGYGILCLQDGANPTIRGNEIVDNNIHPDQVNWGFGIACNGNNAPIVAENDIYGHWYGVATINGGQPNLGDLVNDFPGDDGGNYIQDNGLGEEIFGFYNNTPLPQMAQGNWWGGNYEWQVEEAIFHQVDDPTLGLVNYDLWMTVAAADDLPGAGVLADVSAYPNPFNPRIEVSFRLADASHVTVTVMDVAGRLLRELHVGELGEGEHRFVWDGADRSGRPLASGVYFYRVVAGAEAEVGKVVLAR